MAVNLTVGAVAMMASGDNTVLEMNPVVQVTDLRPVNPTHQQQQGNSNAQERYRLVLSDGEQQQQGMLATQKNELVKSGKLQKGSVVQLNQFVCNTIQNRRIVIIIDLKVILERCDLIGNPPNPVARPKPNVPVQSSADQPSAVAGNSQSVGDSVSGGVVSNAGASLQYPRMDQPRSNLYSSNSDIGSNVAMNAPPTYNRTESGNRFPVSIGAGGSYSNQNMGFHNSRAEASHPASNAYVRPPQSPYQRPPSMYVNRGPVTRNEAPPRIIPISALNPYQGRWTIKARVTAKGELRHYNNARGDGKVFSFDLLDSDGGEIRATCFNAVADQFYNQIEAGRVYMISKGSLKPAQKNFNHLCNDHEILLESTSIIQPCSEDDSSIPQQQFHFRPISDIESMDNNSVVDVIGVVTSINPTSSIMRKNGIETQKRTMQLRDMSGRSVEITIWGNFCNAEGQQLQSICDRGVFPVLAVKAGRVSDFNGKAVSTISTSKLFIEPDFPEAMKLKHWFANEGRNNPSISISRDTSGIGRTESRKTISQIKGEKLGTSEKPDWITISATISFIKMDNFCYTACPRMIGERQCNRKVTNNGDGQWRCDRCEQCVDECDYRYILQFQIQDHTGLTWVTAFQESGVEVIGMPAKDLFYLKYEEQDDERFADITRKVCFSRYIFKLKVKEEMYNDEMRVKSTVVKAERVDFASESRLLLDMLGKLKVNDPTSAMTTENTTSKVGMSNVKVENSGGRQGTASSVSYGGSNINGSREYGVSQAAQFGSSYNLTGQGQSLGGSYPLKASIGGASSGSSGECYKCHQPGHWARDCPGLSSVPPANGSSGYASGRYGAVSRQQFGGY